MGKKATPVNPAQSVVDASKTAYQKSLTPSDTENQMGGVTNQFQQNYNQAAGQNMQDYGNIMGQYDQFNKGLGGPSKFSFQNVTANRPEELGESYGYLREAMPGYRDFASTGGYSDKDQQELRARGISPIRSAYGNTMQELNRARSIGGGGGSPNYIAAMSKAQRDLPEQLANATTNVNAGLAEQIREGKKFGLQGISGTGATMGGLSSQEAGRQLQAALANQAADLQTQQMGEQSLQNLRQAQLQGIGGQTSLYGSSPGMASTFGNQALNAWQTRAGMENNRNQFGLDALGRQMQGYGVGQEQQRIDAQKKPWWQTALQIGGAIAPFALAPFTGGASLLGSSALAGGGMTKLAPSIASGFVS